MGGVRLQGLHLHQWRDVKSLLVLVRCILLFNSPMEIYDDNLSTGFFQCFDILFYLRCTFLVIRKLIDSGNTDFDSFYFEDLHPVITKGSNSGIVQCGDCIGVALLPIVMTVVISEIGRSMELPERIAAYLAGALKAKVLASRAVSSVRVPSILTIDRSSFWKMDLTFWKK